MGHTDNLLDRGSELDYLLGSYSEESEGEGKNEIEVVIIMNSSRERLIVLELDFEKEDRPTDLSVDRDSNNDLCDSDDIIPASDKENGP